VTTRAIKRAKHSQILTTKLPTNHYRPDALPVAQPTLSEH